MDEVYEIIRKKAAAWLLLASIGLTACSEASVEEETQAETAAQADAAPIETEEDEQKTPAYPYEIWDLEGGDFTILICDDGLWTGTFHVIDFEEETGESINDALFRRARFTEEMLNCLIKIHKPTTDMSAVYREMVRAVAAGDTIYDAAYAGLSAFGAPLTGAHGLNLHEIKTLHFDEPWWNQMFIEDMTINDTLYTTIDYVNMMEYGYSNVLFFNAEMFETIGIELPYDHVREGSWTYDTMEEYLEAGVSLNGADKFNSYKTAGSPAIWGYAIQHQEGTMVMLDGAGEFLVRCNEDGVPYLRTDLERLQSAYEKLTNLFADSGYCLMRNGPAMDAFETGHALFFQTALGVSADRFREIEFKYGILPLPKLDEEQDRYYTMISEYTLSLQIPKSVSDPEKSGMVIDFMGYHGFLDIVPVMQTSFCYKDMRDEDSVEMMNITLDTMSVDVGYLYDWSASLVNMLADQIAAGRNTFSSTMASRTSTIETLIKKTLKAFDD